MGRRADGGCVVSLVAALVAAGVLVAAAVGRMLGRTDRRDRSDIHWGDWPPDQMAP